MTDVMVAGIVIVLVAFLTYGYLLGKAYLKVKYPPKNQVRNQAYGSVDNLPRWTSSTTYYPREKEKDESIVSKESVFQDNKSAS